jgi:hypothetical protein
VKRGGAAAERCCSPLLLLLLLLFLLVEEACCAIYYAVLDSRGAAVAHVLVCLRFQASKKKQNEMKKKPSASTD